MPNTHIQEVEQSHYGTYVWKSADGRYYGDEDGNYMCIASKRGDIRKIDLLREAAQRLARASGIEFDGGPEFRAGARPISQSEWEEQKAREAEGYVPDKYDLGNLIDEYNFQKRVDGA